MMELIPQIKNAWGANETLIRQSSREILTHVQNLEKSRSSHDLDQMKRAIWKNFLPERMVLFNPADEASPPIRDIASFVGKYMMVGGKSTAYARRNRVCKFTTTNPEELAKLLQE